MLQLLGALLLIGALVFGLVGLSTLTKATMGVGFIAFGCLLGILGRIVQAQAQHKEIVE